jgi:hypothetical protein
MSWKAEEPEAQKRIGQENEKMGAGLQYNLKITDTMCIYRYTREKQNKIVGAMKSQSGGAGGFRR